ncbi:MAG: alpha/beta fold hydrolase [Elusimicrobia bacterium]|nr:alpha/beta fold hydrolase [Elusimicrobiota bacterium]
MKRARVLAACVAAAFLGLNVAAYRQARSMIRANHKPNRQSPTDFGMTFETVAFPGARGVPVEAWLARAPKSSGLVILFHGYHDSKGSVLPAAREFARFGYDTLLVDFNGSGGSAGDETTVGYVEAEVVVEAVRWSRERFPGVRPILFGASMGAVAILRAVDALDVEARAVILEAPFDRMLCAVRHRLNRRWLPADPLAEFLLFWGGVQTHFNGFRHNPVEYARGVRCPALLLFGDKDPNISLAETEEIYGNLPAAKSLHVFHGAAHQLLATARPTEWRQAVRAFLKSL